MGVFAQATRPALCWEQRKAALPGLPDAAGNRRPRCTAQVLSERLGLLYPVLLLGQSLLIAVGCLGVMCLGLRRCVVRRLAYRPLTASAVV